MIHSDHIEYSVCNDSTRLIFHQEDFSIAQYVDSIAYDLPNFFLVMWQDGAISLVVGLLTFVCKDAVTGVGEGIQMTFRDASLEIILEGVEIHASVNDLDVCGMKYRIGGNRAGEQTFEVPIGASPADIFQRYPARLFVLRNDFVTC
jgi:hypothetical protein